MDRRQTNAYAIFFLGDRGGARSSATLPVAAHHGWAGNGEEEFELVGTVDSGVSLAGPHGTMKVRDGRGPGVGHHAGARRAHRARGVEGRRHPGRRQGHHSRSSQQGPEAFRDQDRASELERQDVQRLPRSQLVQVTSAWTAFWRGSRVPPWVTPCAMLVCGHTASSTCSHILGISSLFGAALVLDLRLLGAVAECAARRDCSSHRSDRRHRIASGCDQRLVPHLHERN